MYLLNLSLAQFLAVLGVVWAAVVALYLLDRTRLRQVVSTLRFWVAAEQPAQAVRRTRIQQPLSLALQLLGLALLLAAIAQVRWGAPAAAPRNHVLILDTSAWMGARSGAGTLLDAAKERARAYLRAVPARDHVMLVRADGLTTPVTAFETGRGRIEAAILESQPGSTALNLDQALAFARRVQGQAGRAGEIAFVGAGRLPTREPGALAPPRNLRVILVPDAVENCGLRKVGLRRSASDPEVWEIFVSARNYGTRDRVSALALSFGPPGAAGRVSAGSRAILLRAGADAEATFSYRTRAAGVIEVDLLPRDAFPADDRARLELPAQPVIPVTVYAADPAPLRTILDAIPHLRVTYRAPSQYRTGDTALAIFDRFNPPQPPAAGALWIDPPAAGSPIAVRARPRAVPFARWTPDAPLAEGLRIHDFKLDAASVFDVRPGDIVAAEVDGGPVIVARSGKFKIVVLGFHPLLSPLRYELAAPLLFANILRWLQPEIFRRRELNAVGVGAVNLALDEGAGAVKVLAEDGTPLPYTVRGRDLEFYAGTPGTVRVVAGDRESVYSMILPELWESRWEPPAEARHGVPRPAPAGGRTGEIWHWLALAGAAALTLEWVLFGRFRRARTALAPLRFRRRTARVAGGGLA